MGDAHTLCITAGSGNSFKPMLVLRQQGDAGPADTVRIRSHLGSHVAARHADDFPRWHHDGCAALAV